MKNNFFSRLKWITFSAVIIALVLPVKLFAQDQTGSITPAGLLDTVVDYLGGKYSLGEIAVNDRMRSAARGYSAPSTVADSCSSGYFRMYLETGCGLEGTSPVNVARRNVVCQVLYDISQFIHSPLTGTPQKINMWVRCRDSVGTLPPNFIGVAAAFYNIPNSTVYSGVQDNAVWITLNSGTDAYKNVTSPLVTTGATYSYGATFFHGWMAFNTDTTVVKWNTSLTSPPDTGYADLYQVALHEVLHALGFASLIDYNGLSKFGVGYQYFTRYDQHLKTQGGSNLIQSSDACNLYQWGFNSSLSPTAILSPGGTVGCPSGYTIGGYIDDTDCSHAIDYVDGSMTQPVYTSFCFQPASSLSHFEDYCKVPSSFVLAPPASNNQYFLMANSAIVGPYDPATRPGAMKRFPKPEERQVLCDIGYIVDTVFGDSTHLNYNNYHTTVCGNQIAGIDDGITAGGAYKFFTTGTIPVNIDSLLSNDYNADSFKCLELIVGSGTLSAVQGTDATTITFTPAAGAFGVQLLRYIPKNTSTGAEGNITYVYVYVGDSNCTPTACDLVSNGGFESIDTSTHFIDFPYLPGAIHCWTPFCNSPDLFYRYSTGWSGPFPSGMCTVPTDAHPLSSGPNNVFITLSGGTSAFDLGAEPGAGGEALQEQLSSTLTSGTSYRISFWAKIANHGPYTALSSQVQLAVGSSTTPYVAIFDPYTYTSLPAGLTPLYNAMVQYHGTYTSDTDGWQYFDTTLTYTGPPANALVVFNAYWLNPTTGAYAAPYGTYIILDDISIKPALSLPTFHLPDPLCTNSGIINLDTTVNVSGGIFKWLTDSSGHVRTTTDTMFRPDSAYYATTFGMDTGLVTVCYYYTGALGCQQTICANTHIHKPPTAIIGNNICLGATEVLTDSVAGGTWSSSNTSVATIGSTTGILTGVSVGTVTITYTIATCFVTKIITINPVPSTINSFDTMSCIGYTGIYDDSVFGGTWSISPTGIATITDMGFGEADVVGVSAGIATITYTLPGGCFTTIRVTVNPLPGPITGIKTICVGSTTLLSDTSAGGVWSSYYTSVATVGSSTGLVTGVGAGIGTIAYTLPDGCGVTTNVTVNPVPTLIFGSTSLCVGSTISLTDTTAGGTWSSSNTTVGSIGSATGIFVGSSTGTTTVSYILSTGCYTTLTITVTPLPATITGTMSVCVGLTTALTDITGGGVWSSSNTGVGTIGSTTGIVTGISGGTTTITYTLSTGCFITATVTVHPLPSAISGTFALCAGTTTTLTDATAGGTWSSSNTGVANIGSATGIVDAVTSGTTTITYTLATGCIITQYITVNPLPAAITGTLTVCVGLTTTLTDATGGGTWSSSDPGVGSINTTTGVVTGISPGTTIITYTLGSTGCMITATVTVNSLPEIITGSMSVCVGMTTTLTDATGGGTWSSSDTDVATVGSGTGIVTGVTSGTAIITYSLGTGCIITAIVTVNPLPAAISGSMSLCVGSTTALTDATGGGVWSSGSTGIATIGSSTGIVSGIAAGTAVITYTPGTGCITTTVVTVIPIPAPINGPNSVCVGDTISLEDATLGGTWSSSNTAIGSVNSATGVVAGISPGIITITYSLGGICIATTPVTVNPTPGPINGVALVCVGTTTALTDTSSGGVWSSGNTAIGSVDVTGLVTGVTGGTVTIIYTLPGGCSAAIIVTVFPLPAAITGIDSVCVGSTTTLNDATSGGTWSSSDTGVATVGSSSGIVTGVTGGTAIITYTLSSGSGCTTSITTTVTVNPLPFAGGIIGADSVCVGGMTSLLDSVLGGVWVSGDTTLATVDTLGNVTGVAVGTVVISYTITSGSACRTTIMDTIKVVTTPSVPPITGHDTVCVLGLDTLYDAVSGGVWSSYNTSIANVDPVSGVVTGGSPGTVVIAYDVSNDCGTTEVLDTIIVIPLTPPITGVLAVCSGSTDTLGNIIGGGSWSSNNTGVATIDSATGIVTGVSTGTATISYVATSVCGTFTATAVVAVNMPPYITTNFIVACQSLGGGKTDHTHILTDTSGCIYVCDSTTVRYYANGVAGSVFTWVVTGGTVVANYGGDSIDVFWPTTGTTGSITLSDTFSHCIGQSTVCFKVIQKPHAYFIPSSVNVCLNTSVVFVDLSTADLLSPIVSWYWNFGDGTYSSVISPTHTFTTGNPNDTVTLVVKNACNCSDTFRVVLNISKTPGPVISCASIVCDSQNATYSIPDDGCTGSYSWGVIGGTIVSGAGTASIVVDWNAVGPDGYGYVAVIDPCNACTDTTVIKIPVILANAPITGPDTICANQEYEYTLPLWAATQYMWGVLGDPGAIVAFRDDYKVVVNFSTPGTYTIHGWYQNTIALCGGNVFKTITVLPPIPITGNTTVCQYETDSFTVGGLAANWTLIDDITGSVITTGSGTTFFNTFSTPGVYLLSATGAFCANPITITVLTAPPTVDSMKGPDTICLGRVYTYTAYSNIPGTVFNWQAIGGTVTPSSGSATVNVIWTAGGSGMQLLVSHVSTVPPYCAGLPTTMNIMQEVINPTFTGDLMPCSNSNRTYATGYYRGEVYDWSIYPNTAGSVVAGEHGTSANILWNNVDTMTVVDVILTVHKCDSIVSDTVSVYLQPSPPVTIVGSPDPGCPATPLTFTAAAGGSSYTWDFGDGSGLVTTTGNTVTHSFPFNTSTGNVTYVVEVTVLPSVAYPCPLSGVGTFVETILPGPVAYATDGEPWVCVGTTPTTTLVGTATDNVGTLTYQWYGGSGAITGATDGTYTANATGVYSFAVTASNGCSNTSNGVLIGTDCPGGGIPCHTLTATTSTLCNVITLTGTTTGGTSPFWQAVTADPTGTTIFPGMTANVTYNYPGVYGFYFHETFGTCDATQYVTASIEVVPDFVYELHCADSTIDSVILEDRTAYLPGGSIVGFTWSEATLGIIGTGVPNLRTAFAAPGTYVITENVAGTGADGVPFNCAVTHTINVPAKPNGTTAEFTFAVSPICSTVPISFTPTSTTGIVGYNWDFGDGSSILLQNPQREYTYEGTSPPFRIDTVTLTVTDSLGCSADTFNTVRIQTNVFDGNIGPSPLLVCSNDAPVTLAFNNISIFTVSSYLWSTGATTSTISVGTSGAYWVTVTGSFQCQKTFTFPATEVEIINTPIAHISGQQDYCNGEPVKLSCYAGTGISYQWFVNGTADGMNPYIYDAGLAPGDYVYQLVLGVVDSSTGAVICSDTATDTIHIFKLPPPPVITGPIAIDCSDYNLQLTATEPGPGYYNWSDGNTGAVDNIYNGGSYEVWFTDLNGCVSNSTVYVPLSTDFFMQYFPTGCYDICKQQLPLTLYGPPDELFHPWKWLRNGTVVSTGTGLMSPYTITTGGNYRWALNNGLCNERSGIMDVNVIDCSQCGKASITAKLSCTPGNPASYTISITLYSPAAGTTYTLGTNMGPIDPFSGTLPTTGPYGLTLTYTTLSLPPLPNIEVEVIFTLPGGGKCFKEVKVAVPPCGWIAERVASGGDSSKTDVSEQQLNVISNALLIFPNPASGEMTISYDYGAEGYNQRSLSVYDEMGRKIQTTVPQDIHGNWILNAKEWVPGVYIVRMEGDGKALQTQRVVIAH